jgi:DNA (cytosine-5)-methyltransferase 1
VLEQPVGRYRAQYTYTCPKGRATVDPYVQRTAGIGDWFVLGARIGDRKRPLLNATQAKNLDGLHMVREPAFQPPGL